MNNTIINDTTMNDNSLMVVRYAEMNNDSFNNNTVNNNVPAWIEDNEKEHIIIQFLNREIADKTKTDYIHNIRHFFGVGSLEDITIDMIVNVSPSIAENYKNELINSGLVRGSVRTKITHLRTLFEYIMNKCVDNSRGLRLLQGNPFNSIKVKTSGKNVMNGSKSYGSYTREEVSKLIKVAMKDFALLYELAVVTALRKKPLLDLNLNDIKMIQGKWCVTVDWDKTMDNLVEPISNDLYERCCKIAREDGKIFTMSSGTVNNQLKKDSIKIGISEDNIVRRKLVFHSLKSTSVDLALVYSGNDMSVVKDHAHHGSIDTTFKFYAGKEKNPNNDISNKFELHDVNYDSELKDRLRNMDRMELMDLIMGLNKDIKNGLLEDMIVCENRM